MIEKTVITHLTDALETENVYAERPETPPAEYWIIEKTGGGEENYILRATVAVQSISSVSLLRAAEMSEQAEKAMKRLIEVENVSRCSLNSAYNFTDTTSKEYRYQAVFDVTYMEGA